MSTEVGLWTLDSTYPILLIDVLRTEHGGTRLLSLEIMQRSNEATPDAHSTYGHAIMQGRGTGGRRYQCGSWVYY